MRTRLDVYDYLRLTADQRRAVEIYLADELDLPLHVRHVTAVEATAEGAVRVERYASNTPRIYAIGPPCPRCGVIPDAAYWRVRQTMRPAVPPPWLAWPDPTEEADPDAC